MHTFRKFKLVSLLAASLLIGFASQSRAGAPDGKMTQEDADNINRLSPGSMAYGVGDRIADSLFAGKPFKKTVILSTTNAAAGTTLLSSTDCASANAYVTNVFLKVNGATLWGPYSGGSFSKIQLVDKSSATLTAGNQQMSVSSGALSGNAFLTMTTTGTTLNTGISLQQGTTTQTGLAVVANSSVTAGSDIYFTASGFCY